MDNSLSLRPDFTARLGQQLGKGACINLVGPHGQGRRRTLADLRQQLPDHMRVWQLNMHTYQHDAAAFLTELQQQSTCTGSFNRLLETMASAASPGLLILHNFDTLQTSGSTAAYGADFFHTLNQISNIRHLALLCVNTQQRTHELLRLDNWPLPALTAVQLHTELLRRLPTLSTDESAAVTAGLLLHPAPYSALKHYACTACA